MGSEKLTTGSWRYRICWDGKEALSYGRTERDAQRNCERWASGFGWRRPSLLARVRSALSTTTKGDGDE